MSKSARLVLRKESLVVLGPDQAAGIRAGQGGVRATSTWTVITTDGSARCNDGTTETATSSIVVVPTGDNCI